MIFDIEEFKQALTIFLDKLLAALEMAKIDVDKLEMDHVCWRCETVDEYNKMSEFLLNNGSLFHKSIYNGREISLINLTSSFNYDSRTIDLIELPAPKPNKAFKSGFEHAEFVVPTPLNEWINQYPVPWELKNINKSVNPDIRIQLDNICAKFHPYSLAYVVKHLE